MIITNELAARLETAEALDAAACAEAACAVDTDCGPQVKGAGGGILTFCGTVSPLTHALAVGMHGPVSSHELDEIEEFFRSRGAAVAIDLCPHADITLRELLVTRGYRISEMNNVLVRALRPDEEFAIASDVEVTPAGDPNVFARAVMAGFFGREHVTDEELKLGLTLFHMPCATPLLATSAGRTAGGCGISIRNRVAALYGDGVLNEYRGRGVHTATIAERLRRAVAAGCDLATAGTVPGGASQRNYGRFGFEVAYTKLTMVLA